MKIGISRPSSNTEEHCEVFAAARRWGFEGVQVKPHQYEPCGLDPVCFQKTYGELAALAIGGLVVYLGGDPSDWAEKMSAIAPFAGAIGAEQLCLVASVNRSDVSQQRFQAIGATLTAIGEEANRQGTKITVHNHANCLFESGEDLSALFTFLDPTLCGFTLDTAHAAKAGITDIPALAYQFRDRLDNVHLKDMDPEGRFCPLGQGILDNASVLSALRDIGYDGWLIVDEESEEFTTDEAYRLSKEYLQARAII